MKFAVWKQFIGRLVVDAESADEARRRVNFAGIIGPETVRPAKPGERSYSMNFEDQTEGAEYLHWRYDTEHPHYGTIDIALLTSTTLAPHAYENLEKRGSRLSILPDGAELWQYYRWIVRVEHGNFHEGKSYAARHRVTLVETLPPRNQLFLKPRG